jgi:hypothetical protein
MRWTEQVARTIKMRTIYKVVVGRPEGDKLEDLGIDGRMIHLLKG